MIDNIIKKMSFTSTNTLEASVLLLFIWFLEGQQPLTSNTLCCSSRSLCSSSCFFIRFIFQVFFPAPLEPLLEQRDLVLVALRPPAVQRGHHVQGVLIRVYARLLPRVLPHTLVDEVAEGLQGAAPAEGVQRVQQPRAVPIRLPQEELPRVEDELQVFDAQVFRVPRAARPDPVGEVPRIVAGGCFSQVWASLQYCGEENLVGSF
mmetsp:Transcript_4444/g.6281  ORF Transcript_4444/g.6281 Transcript_4444/m.6281 type:complete len:205 (-) Transcript_4444:832-1446(-)